MMKRTALSIHEVVLGDTTMAETKYIYWRDNGMWLGYLEECPDYMTQGESLVELKANLMDIQRELNDGVIPWVGQYK